MLPLTLRAYFLLMFFHLLVKRADFAALYARVRHFPVAQRPPGLQTLPSVCSAVDRACIWYPKELACLPRSAATTCLLKQHGIEARMIIGVRRMPFAAHAWVEVDGRVVNDKPYMPEMYAVLDRW
jgi:hypothetical protein